MGAPLQAEVFTDTFLLCTVTALVVMVSWGDVVARDGEFMMMTVTAYEAVLGKPAAMFMSLSVLFFGFATVVCWAHYGFAGVRYFSASPVARRAFMVLYSISVLAGAVVGTDTVWQVADFAIGMMTVINLVMLVCMSGEVRCETEKFLRTAREKK